jgi:hypothetical protein
MSPAFTQELEMFLANLIALFSRSRSYVWKPALTLDNPEVVSAIMPDLAR